MLEGDIRHFFHQLKLHPKISPYFCVRRGPVVRQHTCVHFEPELAYRERRVAQAKTHYSMNYDFRKYFDQIEIPLGDRGGFVLKLIAEGKAQLWVLTRPFPPLPLRAT